MKKNQLTDIQMKIHLSWISKSSYSLRNYYFYTTALSFIKYRVQKLEEDYPVPQVEVLKYMEFFNKYFQFSTAHFATYFAEFLNSGFVSYADKGLKKVAETKSWKKIKAYVKKHNTNIVLTTKRELGLDNKDNVLEATVPVFEITEETKRSGLAFSFKTFRKLVVYMLAAKPEFKREGDDLNLSLSNEKIAEIVGLSEPAVYKMLRPYKKVFCKAVLNKAEFDRIKFRNQEDPENYRLVRNFKMFDFNEETGEFTSEMKYEVYIGKKVENVKHVTFRHVWKNPETGKVHTDLIRKFTIDIEKPMYRTENVELFDTEIEEDTQKPTRLVKVSKGTSFTKTDAANTLLTIYRNLKEVALKAKDYDALKYLNRIRYMSVSYLGKILGFTKLGKTDIIITEQLEYMIAYIKNLVNKGYISYQDSFDDIIWALRRAQ